MAPLSLEFVRQIAAANGYREIQFNEESRVVAFENSAARINVYYTTGTVATCIEHPRQGRTQLFRRNRTEHDLAQIFRDPRTHTGAGYYRRQGNEAWQTNDRRLGSRGPITDDEQRWRYIQAATGFCNDQQANQIAAFCRLWNQLKYMPGGITSREEWERMDDEIKAEIESLFGPRGFCEDGCGRCTDRAGSWCCLTAVLMNVAFAYERVIAVMKSQEDDTDETIIKGAWEFARCPCRQGAEFRRMYGSLLDKLEHQLRSFPSTIRVELILWFVEKHFRSPYKIIYLDDERRPHNLFERCREDVCQCHEDYGELTYPDDAKGCKCHGI